VKILNNSWDFVLPGGQGEVQERPRGRWGNILLLLIITTFAPIAFNYFRKHFCVWKLHVRIFWRDFLLRSDLEKSFRKCYLRLKNHTVELFVRFYDELKLLNFLIFDKKILRIVKCFRWNYSTPSKAKNIWRIQLQPNLLSALTLSTHDIMSESKDAVVWLFFSKNSFLW
jgi:hypothetical protein